MNTSNNNWLEPEKPINNHWIDWNELEQLMTDWWYNNPEISEKILNAASQVKMVLD